MTNATFRALKPEFIFSIFLFLASSAKVSEALFTMFHDAVTFIYSSIFTKLKCHLHLNLLCILNFQRKVNISWNFLLSSIKYHRNLTSLCTWSTGISCIWILWPRKWRVESNLRFSFRLSVRDTAGLLKIYCLKITCFKTSWRLL